MDFTTKELLKRYAKLAIGQPFSPVLLNILVTSVCDMRCTHCFFTDELDDRPRKKLQMKTHEIERISETLGGNLSVLILAGGEPFTRKDLPEIARAFYTNNQLESIYIMSNGQIQKRIFPDVSRVLEECPNLNVTVALGIDGPKNEHEKIRQKLGSLEIDHARYAKLAQMIDDDSRHAVLKNNYSGKAGFFKAAIDIYMHGLIAKTQETQVAQMKCYAGTAGGVIYDEGTVSSCENLAPIGNLRDFDWNFQKLWLSPAMKERRKKAAAGCFCTHESNSYYPSLPFNPGHLIQIKKLEREMKKARKGVDRVDPEPDGVRVAGF